MSNNIISSSKGLQLFYDRRLICRDIIQNQQQQQLLRERTEWHSSSCPTISFALVMELQRIHPSNNRITQPSIILCSSFFLLTSQYSGCGTRLKNGIQDLDVVVVGQVGTLSTGLYVGITVAWHSLREWRAPHCIFNENQEKFLLGIFTGWC